MQADQPAEDKVSFQSLEQKLNELIETANDLQNMSGELRGQIIGYGQEGHGIEEDKKAREPEGYLEKLSNQMNDLRWRLSDTAANLDKLRSRV